MKLMRAAALIAVFAVGSGLVYRAHAAPSRAAEQVQLFNEVGTWSVSPDGRFVVTSVITVTRPYRSGDTGSASTQIRALDPPFPVVHTFVDAVAAPTWSPSSQQLAFIRRSSGKQGDVLAIWDRTRRAVRVYDNVHVAGNRLQWSPDGRFILCQTLDRTRAPNIGKTDGASSADPTRSSPAVEVRESDALRFLRTGQAPRDLREIRSAWNTDRVRRSAERKVHDIAMVEVATGRQIFLMRGEHASEDFTLAPDGRHLLVKMYSHQVALDVNSYTTFYDWYLAPVPALTQIAKTEKIPAHPAHGSVDFAGRALEPLRADVAQDEGVWSPDGQQYVFVMFGEAASRDVTVLDVATRTFRTVGAIPSQPVQYKGLHWAPDGRTLLAFGSDARERGMARRRTLWSIDLSGASPRDLTVRLPDTVSFSGWVVQPDAPTRAATLPEDPEGILLQTFDPVTYREGFARVDLRTGEVKALVSEAESHALAPKRFAEYRSETRAFPYALDVADAVFAHDGRTALYGAEHVTSPRDVWAVNLGEASPQMRSLGIASQPVPDPATGRLLTWSTAPGETAKGILVLPAGASPQAPVPLVAILYPGIVRSTRLHAYDSGWQFNERALVYGLLARGFGVLRPDMISAKQADHPNEMPRLLMPAVDAAVATGLVDGSRVGIMGHSFGGYTVNTLITRTSRFAAAVSLSGPANDIFDYLYDDGRYEGDSVYRLNIASADAGVQKALGGTLWQYPERFIRNSPVFALDQVTTPLLLIHGANDATVPPHHAAMMYNGLAHLGKPVELALYKGAGHRQVLGETDGVDDRVIGWFEEWLGESRRQTSMSTRATH